MEVKMEKKVSKTEVYDCITKTIGKVFYMIDDFQRGKTFEGWGEIFSMLLMVGVAVYVNVKYFKEKDKE